MHERLRRRGRGVRHRQREEPAERLLRAARPRRILDAGCGAGPLPFADGEFDDVIASLVLHYLEDWGPTLAEMRRVLRPGGRLIASVNHPTAEYSIERVRGRRPDYFESRAQPAEWSVGDQLTDFGLNALRDEKILSRDQLFDEVLVTKYGAAKAAEVRKPLGG